MYTFAQRKKTIRKIQNNQMEQKRNFKVFSGTKSHYLAEKICASLGCELGNLSITKFSDGEFEVCFEESIRGVDVFLVQSTFPNADNLMELLLMIDEHLLAPSMLLSPISVGLVRIARASRVLALLPNWLQICFQWQELTD